MIDLRRLSRTDATQVLPRGHRAGWLVGVFVAELLALAWAYQFLAQIECHQLGAQALCEGLKSLVARAIVVLAVAGVVLTAHPQARSRFVAETRAARGLWALVHLTGLGLLFLPLIRTGAGDLGAGFDAALGPWILGGAAAALGGLFWLAPPRAWLQLGRDLGPLALAALGLAALTPDLAEAIRPIWDWSVLTRLTFEAVALFLSAFALVAVVDPVAYVIGVQAFAVHIAPQCSGVEGLALVTAFVAIYAAIFRETLRMGRFLVLVLPVALVLSWVLNVVRIGVLILLGANVSPDIAVNGFHSYAGWLFFTLLALGLVAVVQATPWLHRGAVVARGHLPLRQDQVAAALVPFILFMVVSSVTAALAPHPELGYPVKALVLLAAVVAFWPAYRRLIWRADPLAWGVGLVIGVGWVVLAQPGDEALARLLALMTPFAWASWLALRLLGTVLLVPLIEELFFRGYVLTRIAGPSQAIGWKTVFAVAVSTAGFAALHGRWLEAGLAGLLFAALVLFRGTATAAVQAHIAANGLIAAVAVWRGDFSLI